MDSARLADSVDLPILAQLAARACHEMGAMRGGALYALREGPPEPAAEMAAALGDPRRSLWAGCIDDHVVGYALARVVELNDGSPHGVIEALYVEPGARGVGVGGSLVEAVVDWLAAWGCRGVDASSLPGQRATKSLLEQSGFRARLVVMHKELRTI